MTRNREHDRANLGEQADLERTDVERQDRSMSAGAHGDSRAGSEGIDDPTTERGVNRESVQRAHTKRSGRAGSGEFSRAARRSRQQSRDRSDRASFTGQGRQKEHTETEQGTGYPGKSRTDDPNVS